MLKQLCFSSHSKLEYFSVTCKPARTILTYICFVWRTGSNSKGSKKGKVMAESDKDKVTAEKSSAVPSALEALEPVIRRLLSSLRGVSAASEALLLFGDPVDDKSVRILRDVVASNGDNIAAVEMASPTLSKLGRDFPQDASTVVTLDEKYAVLWSGQDYQQPEEVLWVPMLHESQFFGGILLSGGSVTEQLSPAAKVEVKTASEHLGSLLSQVVRLERENKKLTQLIQMLQMTRTLMRESEAGQLLNMVLNTLSRIVGNNRLALFPTTVLGKYWTFIRHVDFDESENLHNLVLKRLDPRADLKVQGRQACTDIAAMYPDQEFSSFARATPWVLRDVGRTYLGVLYLFDNDPAQEDTLSHAVIRTIIVELEHTLRRYLLEDATVHAISELPYRIWSREYWLRRFEEEINLTGRRGTRVTCGILEVVNYDELLEEMDDLILKESILTFIQVIKASVRETDLICRLDRNHFGVLFLDAAKSKVMPALERISTQIQRIVGGLALEPRINFVAGLAEFPWDGEEVLTLLRKTWTAVAMAHSKGAYVLQLYDHDEAQTFLKSHEEVREEISVRLELLGELELADVTITPSPSPPEER